MRHLFAYSCIIFSMTMYAASSPEENQKRDERKIFIFHQLNRDLRLYEIDKNFALQVDYDNKDISVIRVAPKYHFDEMLPIPDYPKYLQAEQYDELLELIKNTKRLGERVQWGEMGICSNNICTSRERYEDGIIMRYEIPGRGYFGFRITYYRKISGRIDKKERDKVGKDLFAYSIKMNGKWYWTVKDEYEKCAENEYVTIQHAAPCENSL